MKRVRVEGDGDSGAAGRAGCLDHAGDELLVASVDAIEDADGHV